MGWDRIGNEEEKDEWIEGLAWNGSEMGVI